MTPDFPQLCGGGSRQRPIVRVVDRVISSCLQTMPDGSGNAMEELLMETERQICLLVFAVVGDACRSHTA